jgi:hypothetical protein
MVMDKKKLNRNVIIGSLTILVTIGVVLYFVISAENKLFKEKSVTVEATIIEKWEMSQTSRRTTNTDYYFKVAFFTDEKPLPKPEAEIAPDTTKSKVDIMIDKIFEDIDLTIGDYQTAECEVSGVKYTNKSVGSKVKITYLSDDPERIRIAE